MRTNRILSAALVACGAIGLSTSAHATNGYQLIGVGAYQKGMGGAVTANPGSAMTAITNPAGMATIGNRADFSMEAFMPDRSVDFTKNAAPGGSAADGEKENSEAGMYGIPAIGWTAPVSEGSDIYFGGGMYGTSGLGVDYGVTNFAPATADATNPAGADFSSIDFSGYSSIAFWQMAPTLAWNVNDQLSVGASLNIDYQSVGFQQRITGQNTGNNAYPSGPLESNFLLGRTANAFGFGITIGGLYEINEMITVGASYKSKQEFSDLEYQLREGDIQNFPDGDGGFVTSNDGTYKLGLDYPQQLAAGIKVTPMDRLKISADVKWINWSDTMDKLSVTGDFDGGYNGTGGASSNDAAMDPGWDDQVVYALGVDYMVTSDLNLRAGYNYSEAPLDEKDVFSNLLLPALTEQHVTLGATYRFNNHWEASFAYMKAFDNAVTGEGDVPESYQSLFGTDSQAKINLEETSYSVNIGYRF